MQHANYVASVVPGIRAVKPEGSYTS